MVQEFDRLPFTKEEYLTRRQALQKLMMERGVDACILTTTANMYYLTGFGSLAYGTTALIIRDNGEALWVARLTELSNVRALHGQLWANEGVGVSDNCDYASVLARAIADFVPGNCVLGVEYGSIPAAIASFVKPGVKEIMDVTGLVEQIRRVKSPAEIDLLRQAGRIVATACRDGFAALHEGMKDSELAMVVTNSLMKNGSHRMAQMPNVCAGPRTARAHVTWAGAPIKRGELVNIEPAASLFDYHTPVFRFGSIGKPEDRVLEFFDVCQESLAEGIARIRPGMSAHEAARIFEGVIERRGLAQWMVTRPAYGIGCAFPPGWGEDKVVAIKQGSEVILEEGMCFHIVPVLYQDGVGCVGASQPSLLTAQGFVSLSGDEVAFAIK